MVKWEVLGAYLGALMASKKQLKQIHDKIYLNKVMRY